MRRIIQVNTGVQIQKSLKLLKKKNPTTTATYIRADLVLRGGGGGHSWR